MSVLGLVGRRAPVRLYEVVHVVQVLALVVALEILKRRKALPDLVAFFTPSRSRTHPDAGNYRRLVTITNVILSRIYGRDFCMPRSFVLFYLMRRRGFDVDIHFGVTRYEGALRGHAWLEMDGTPISEAKDPRGAYTTVCSFPSSIHSKTTEVLA